MLNRVKALILNFLTTAGLVLGLAVMSLPAHAVTFDFVALEGSVGEGSWDSRGGVLSSGTWTLGGLGVTASAGTGDFAYLDGPSGGPGGLGVCGTVTATFQCDPSSDDNIQDGEKLTLTFTSAVTLEDLLFRGANHGVFDGTLLINSFVHTVVAGVLSAVDGSLGLTKIWMFEVDPDGKKEFYLSSLNAVPLPAAGILFGSALVGIGFLSRRRRRNKARTALLD